MPPSALVAAVASGAGLRVGHEVTGDDSVEDQQDHQRKQEEQGYDHEEEDYRPEAHCLGEADGYEGAILVLCRSVVCNGGDRAKTCTPTVFPITSNRLIRIRINRNFRYENTTITQKACRR